LGSRHLDHVGSRHSLEVRCTRMDRRAAGGSALFSRADQIDEAPPGNPGDQTTLVGRHATVHYFFGKLLRFLERFAHVADVKRRVWVVFDSKLYGFGPLATNDLAR